MAITFKSLSYIYDEGMPYAHKALDDINLNISENKITAIIGETGSGKSTLVEHLNALLLPSAGSLEILDHVIVAKEKNKGLKKLRAEVGLVFQFAEYQLFEESILKDAAFGPKNFGFSEEEAIERGKKALNMVGIPESMYQRSPLDLSGGQKRRVAIAGILAIDPKILVLDEPTAGLDPKGAKEMIDLFVELNHKHHKTVVIVSHDNDVVYNYADETVLMSGGKVAYHGPTLDLFEDEKLINDNNLLLPQTMVFKKALIEKGFKISKEARTMDMIVNEVVRVIK